MTSPKSRIGRIVSLTRVFLAAWQNGVICVDQRIRESTASRATSLMYTEKRFGP